MMRRRLALDISERGRRVLDAFTGTYLKPIFEKKVVEPDDNLQWVLVYQVAK
jgi:hypothetical protein